MVIFIITRQYIDINNVNYGVFMKKIASVLIIGVLLSGCAPKIGSEEWCADLKEKPKADWTATEAKDFAKHCIF